MSRWTPFDEGKNNLIAYDFFFSDDKIRYVFGHPQKLEEWFYKVCPNNFCYVWVYKSYWNTYISGSSIHDMVMGVPENIAIALKLLTGADATRLSDYRIIEYRHGSRYSLEIKCQD